MNCRKLFVSDMDGTLLGADSRVSRRSAEIISSLSREGALITVATARTPGTVEPLLADTLTLPPAVVMTGAAMWSRQERRYRHTHLLSPEKALSVCAVLEERGISPMVYQTDNDGVLRMYCRAGGCATERRFKEERSHLHLKRIITCDNPADMIAGAETILILATGPSELTERATEPVEAVGGLSVSHYSDPLYPGAGFIEVFTEGVTKARGVTDLKAITGAEHVTVFGDNLNDIPMMRVADTAVAVANALPEVKAVADVVIGPNTEDAVARYIAANI